MPFFDKEGRPYREQLETTKTTAKLVSSEPATVEAMNELMFRSRQVAAARASHDPMNLPSELFEQLWIAEKAFVAAARTELGLAPNVPTSLERHLATLEG